MQGNASCAARCLAQPTRRPRTGSLWLPLPAPPPLPAAAHVPTRHVCLAAEQPGASEGPQGAPQPAGNRVSGFCLAGGCCPRLGLWSLADGCALPSPQQLKSCPSLLPRLPSAQPPAPPAEPSSANGTRAAWRRTAIRRAAIEARFPLLASALLFARMHLGWLVRGAYLDNRGWQQLLEQQLLPFFSRLFAAYGEPPQVAASHAAAAAAVQSKNISYKEVLVTMLAAYSALYFFALRAFMKALTALRELFDSRRS